MLYCLVDIFYLYRKIVSESRVMVNGLDMNGVNQQRNDVNEFNDGQPFNPVPHIDWSSGHATAVSPIHSLAAELLSKPAGFTAERNITVRDRDQASGAASERVSETEKTDSEYTEDKADTSNINNSNSVDDQNLVVSDSVKLPPSSSLFSHLKGSETASYDIQTPDIAQNSSLDQQADTEKTSDSVLTECSVNKDSSESATEVFTESSEDCEDKSGTTIPFTETEDTTEKKEEDTTQSQETQEDITGDKAEEDEGPPEKKVTFFYEIFLAKKAQECESHCLNLFFF